MDKEKWVKEYLIGIKVNRTLGKGVDDKHYFRLIAGSHAKFGNSLNGYYAARIAGAGVEPYEL